MLSTLQFCQLAMAAFEDREASYEHRKLNDEDYGHYTRWYTESVHRVLARKRITATAEEQRLIYILAAYGEACEIAGDYVKANR